MEASHTYAQICTAIFISACIVVKRTDSKSRIRRAIDVASWVRKHHHTHAGRMADDTTSLFDDAYKQSLKSLIHCSASPMYVCMDT
jgi:hypothetical protein